MKRQWFYRGSLKSCNYSCSYCPFSKNKGSKKEQQKDETAWRRFVAYMNRHNDIGGALQIVPYGEALIHPYYWKGLAELSQNPKLDAVGAQSNFSFPVEQMLSLYREQGGKLDKLRLWGTFHPEMTRINEFVNQCQLLSKHKVSYCAGAVGVPENIEKIRRLRQTLPSSVYIWINKMDGLGRTYLPEEKEAFLEIDPYFELELMHHKSNMALCGDNRFIEANGTMRRCNLCHSSLGNLYSHDSEEISLPEKIQGDRNNCTRKECSCYLSYCNRMEQSLIPFQPYPAFRIPAYPKAVFFDVDGTLIPEGQTKIPQNTAKKLQHLSKHSAVYLATSRPYETARRGLSPVWDIISGGTFAGGGRRMIWKHVILDEITPIDTNWLSKLEKQQKTAGFRLHIYKKNDLVYKVTLVYQKGRLSETAASQLLDKFAHDWKIPPTCQLLWEDPCLQITAKGTGKLEGILQICRIMGYRKKDVAVFGNSKNDLAIRKEFSP